MSDQDYMNEMKALYEKSMRNEKGQTFSRVLCPHTFDTTTEKKACKMCELSKEVLFDRNKPKNDPIKELARKYNSKKKYYSNMIFISKPDEIVVLEYGDKIFNKLIAGQMSKESEWKNFMHPTQGRNLYITKMKIGPEVKDVDYNVEARFAVTPLPNVQVLAKLVNLQDLLALIESGKVKPLPSSKAFEFVNKTEIRILPAGDRAKPLLFFKQVFWHENLTKEEFEAVQAGKFNPITGLYTQPAEVARPMNQIVVPEVKIVKPDDVLAEWGITEDEAVVLPKEIEAEGGDEDMVIEDSPEPICFGQYDKENAVCAGKCTKDGWGETCKKLYEEKLAVRARAKRLQK